MMQCHVVVASSLVRRIRKQSFSRQGRGGETLDTGGFWWVGGYFALVYFNMYLVHLLYIE